MKQVPKVFRVSRSALSGWLLALAVGAGAPAWAQTASAAGGKVTVGKGTATTKVAAAAPAAVTEFATVGEAMELVIGKSTLLRIPAPIERISVGNPNVADISIISPVELYLLGKSYGSTNLVMWRKGGAATAIDINVSIDAERMEKKLRELMPDEKGIRVRPAADSVILTGFVSSAVKARYAEEIAASFVREINRNLVLPVVAGDGRVAPGTTVATSGQVTAASSAGAKVVNLLRVTDGQQVMLEVKVAEISKDLVEKMGITFNATSGNGGLNYSILSNLVTSGVFNVTTSNGGKINIDASKKDSLVKVLAEPNIIAISGQEASFLAGGKLFVPFVTGTGASAAVSLQEREFGVGVKFTPTVLEGTRINLKVAPEVSEIQDSVSATVNGQNFLLPKFSTNRVQTTVQLNDGQSLAIAGLIKNNVKDSINRVPFLGEIPVLGALFRSTDFTNNRTELVFLITPRLVKPLDTPPPLPTDNFISPSRKEFLLDGQLEGSGRSGVPSDQAPVPAAPAQGQAGGFEVK